MTKEISTINIDPDFDAAHIEAFKQEPSDLNIGDVVFLNDHYWPGRIVRMDEVSGNRFVVEAPTVLDGNFIGTYRRRELRPCAGWVIPSKEHIASLLRVARED